MAMSALLVTILIAVTLFVALVVGMGIRSLLPQEHLSAESKDAVKVSMGMVATMTALLLGLLVSSAKGSYDTTRSELVQMAAKVAFLDRVLTMYGPDATEARGKLRAALGEAIVGMWPEEGVPVRLEPDERAGNAIYVAIHRLTPHDDVQRDLKAQATTLANDLGELRTLLLAQSIPSVSMPMLITVDCWLVVIFASFSLVAPRNATTTVALIVAVLSVVGAVFLVLELDTPLSGIIRISSAPMQKVLGELKP
jgi:hypothetical protein